MSTDTLNDFSNTPSAQLINKIELEFEKFWAEHPNLRIAVDKLKKRTKPPSDAPAPVLVQNTASTLHNVATSNIIGKNKETADVPLPGFVERGAALRSKMNYSFRTIRQYLEPKSCAIEHRICAQNKKNSQATIDEEVEYRSKIISSQIKSWRSMLPGLIKRFSKIPDYRNPNRITHKKTVIMLFGLFAFIFRFASKREINRELTGPVIMGHLREIFPEIDSIPHADTLSRFLEKTDMNEIEKIHVSLIRDLISKKKFKKLLLKGCVPISFDGTQKAFRNVHEITYGF